MNHVVVFARMTWVTFCFLIMAMMVVCTGVSRAQKTPLSTQLATQVRLSLGETRLSVFAQELSRQSGVKIYVAEEIQRRPLIVEIDQLSVRETLDAVAALNEWKWYVDLEQNIRIEQPRNRLPQNVAELSTSLAHALPADLRRFAGIGSSLEQLTPIQNQEVLAGMERLKGMPAYETNMVSTSFHQKKIPVRERIHQQLKRHVKKETFQGQAVLCHRLPAEDQNLLAFILLLEALVPSVSADSYFFHGKLMPFLTDPRLVTIRGNAENLHITGPASKQEGYYSGFGGQFSSQKTP
jgi:hypothetical protein